MQNSLPIVDIYRASSGPYSCSYLPAESATLEYRLPAKLAPLDWQFLLRRGWRRHGQNFFRPKCAHCVKCRSLRVDVERFRPTKSQRRSVSRNADIQVRLTRPAATPEHIELYNAYHADMRDRRGWPHRMTNLLDYSESFLAGRWPFAHELQYRRDGKLVGLGLVDVVPEGVSSIYFYHSPEWRPLSPGTFTVLQEIELVRRLGGRFLYLGYWIAECPSMAYKCRFGPHEILERYVADEESPVWREPESVPTFEELDRN